MSQFATHTPFKKLYVSKVNKHRGRWGYLIRVICTRNIIIMLTDGSEANNSYMQFAGVSICYMYRYGTNQAKK